MKIFDASPCVRCGLKKTPSSCKMEPACCMRHCNQDESTSECSPYQTYIFDKHPYNCVKHCRVEGHGHCSDRFCSSILLDPENKRGLCFVNCQEKDHGHCVLYCDNKIHTTKDGKDLCEKNMCAKHCWIIAHNYDGMCRRCKVYPAHDPEITDECFGCCLQEGDGHCTGTPCLNCDKCDFTRENFKTCTSKDCISPTHEGNTECLKCCNRGCNWHCNMFCEETKTICKGYCKFHCEEKGHGHCVFGECSENSENGDIFCIKHCDDRTHGHCAGLGCSERGGWNCESCEDSKFCRCRYTLSLRTF